MFASSHSSFVDSSLCQKTVVFVGLSVDAAHRSVVIRAFVVHALAFVLHGNSGELQVAQVLVGFVIDSANIVNGFILTQIISAFSPRAELLEIGEHDADVSILLSTGRADWVIVIRTEVGGVEVRRTSTVSGHWDILAIEETFVAISDSINSADWGVFIRTVSTFSDH